MAEIKPFYVKVKDCTLDQLLDIQSWLKEMGVVSSHQVNELTYAISPYYGIENVKGGIGTYFYQSTFWYGPDAVELEYHQVRAHLGLEPKQFTKKDLIPGQHIVSTRDGFDYFVIEGVNEVFLYKISKSETGWLRLSVFEEDLTNSNKENIHFDIVKVSTIDAGNACMDLKYETVWERPEKTPQQIESEEIAQEMSELKAKLEALTERQKELAKKI